MKELTLKKIAYTKLAKKLGTSNAQGSLIEKMNELNHDAPYAAKLSPNPVKDLAMKGLI